MFKVGDMVLVSKGQKTIFFEVIQVQEETAWISNGWVQINRPFRDLELICQAEDRQDKRVPFNRYVK